MTTNGRRSMSAVLALACLSLPAHAAETQAAPVAPAGPESRVQALPTPTLTGMLRSLGRFLTQDDINLLYEYLRDSAIASLFNQEEVYMPPDLVFKMAVLQRRAEIEGNHYLQVVVLPELIRLAPSLFEPEPAATASAAPTPNRK